MESNSCSSGPDCYQLSEVLVIHAVSDMTQTVINGGIMGKNIWDIGRSSMVFMNGN